MRAIATLDLTAPRFREKRHSIINTKFYKSFKKKFPQYKDIPVGELRRIIKTFNAQLWKEATVYRDGVEFPEGLGYIFVGTCGTARKENVNNKLSLEHKIAIQHRNFESDSYLAKIFYTNFASKYKFHNRELWQFIAIRDFKRTVSKEYSKNFKKYVQVDNFAHISKMYKIRSKKQWFKNLTSDAHEEYNEFDL